MAKRKKLYTSRQVDAYNSGPMDVEPGSKRKRVSKQGSKKKVDLISDSDD